MPQDVTLTGAKELFAKEWTIIDCVVVHVIKKNSRCIILNTLVYFQHKYFQYSLCSIGIQFEVYKFTFYMDNKSIVL
jgi:hypothetical protein